MAQPDAVRLQIADLLDAWANEPAWNNESWSRFDALIKSTEADGLLNYAREELIHFSGEFHSYNLLGIRTKPDKHRLADHQETFRTISKAIRSGMTWDEFKRQDKIY